MFLKWGWKRTSERLCFVITEWFMCTRQVHDEKEYDERMLRTRKRREKIE